MIFLSNQQNRHIKVTQNPLLIKIITKNNKTKEKVGKEIFLINF